VEVFNHGRMRKDVIPLWVGEGDLPTPDFILQAAIRSIEAGETFYTAQEGIPDLRAAIARYMTRIYEKPFATSAIPFTPERFFVTVGGMHALQIAVRLVAGPGDEVLILSPAWPNFKGVLGVAGARVVEAPLRASQIEGESLAWSIDIDHLASFITPATKALIINSPSNPTGWVATHDDLKQLLSLARAHGLWIIADEIYGRLTFEGKRAPSFHDIIDEKDRVLFVQTLSKNWAMTGLRVGWLEAPPQFTTLIGDLVQYSTAGVAVPLQRAAIAALDEGEAFFERQLQRLQDSRAILCDGFDKIPTLSFARPKGAFYLFCKIAGISDTHALAFRWIDEAKVGIAPGTAFGEAGRDYVRICFARDPLIMQDAVSRLGAWFAEAR